MQNLAVHVEMIDQIKENSAFYQDYHIRDGDRPDNVAYDLYKNPQLHWTFYFMNDSIKEYGWPLTQRALEDKIKSEFSGITLKTHSDIHMFSKDMIVESDSGATGKVSHIDTSLGHIVIESTSEVQFVSGDVVTSPSHLNSVILISVAPEYLSAHHYTDNNGNIVDYRTKDGWNSNLYEESTLEYYRSINESIRKIRVIKPTSIVAVTSLFNRAVTS
jgi:hypothetical protein